MIPDVCANYGAVFSDQNTHSPAGWNETAISGLCEDCFDEICEEADEEEGYDGPAF